jgi:hypothetical protein
MMFLREAAGRGPGVISCLFSECTNLAEII